MAKNVINKNPDNKTYRITNRQYLMVSCIARGAIDAAPVVIITNTLGLASASVFSIYNLVYMSLRMVIDSIQLSVSAIFGNLIYTADNTKIKDIFSLIELVFIVSAACLAAATSILLIPFIKLYTVGINDIIYIHYLLSITIVITILLFGYNSLYGFVCTVYGFFKATCKIILMGAIIGTLLTTCTVKLFGLNYAMLGYIFFLLYSSLMNVFILKKKLCWFDLEHTFRRSVFAICLPICIYILFHNYAMRHIVSWHIWLLAVIFTVAMLLAFVSIYCYIFEKKYCLQMYKYLKIIKLKRKGVV